MASSHIPSYGGWYRPAVDKRMGGEGSGASGQASYGLRVDWGMDGARALASCDVVVLVDVLSFTTAGGVAVDAGIEVLPFGWGEGAEAFAGERGAVLADRSRSGRMSLSPVRIRAADPLPRRLVLASPNGGGIAQVLAGSASDPVVVAASLRNPAAVAGWVGSPEAELAAAGDGSVRDRLAAALVSCASGRELVTRGYRGDVEIAAEHDRSGTVPLLDGDRSRAAGASA